MAKCFAVVGNPVEHSLSPEIHQSFAGQFGIDLQYQKKISDDSNFATFVNDFFTSGGAGLNITMPFKLLAFELSQQLSTEAKIAKSVNTMKAENGVLFGHNTDGEGLLNDICVNLGQPIRDKRLLILGAGGATQGILYPLLEQNPAQILIANRTALKAKQLAKRFSDYGELCGFALDAIKNKPVDIVINATSVSLSDEIFSLPPDLTHGALCYDLFYGKETAFMRWAKQHHAEQISDGLGMLVEQAAASFEFWHGIRPETQTVIQEMR